MRNVEEGIIIMKNIILYALVLIIIISNLGVSVFALDYDIAVDYTNVIQQVEDRGGRYKFFLVDFDGDGEEELFVISNFDPRYDFHNATCEVYQGDKLIGSEELAEHYIVISRNAKNNKLYMRKYFDMGDAAGGFEAYTVENNEWKKTDDYDIIITNMSTWEKAYAINGQTVSEQEFEAEEAMFTNCIDLMQEETARQEISDVILASAADFDNDIYSNLSDDEKNLIFDDFLYDFAYVAASGYSFDGSFEVKNVPDEAIIDLLVDLQMDTDFSNDTKEFSTDEFDKLTTRYFGRVINYDSFAIDHKPTFEDWGYSSVYYDGQFILCSPQRGGGLGFSPDMFRNTRLYDLSSGKYYAEFEIAYIDEFSDRGIYDTKLFGALISQNTDGTFRLINLGVPMRNAEINEFLSPSDWAVDEFSAASNTGFVPTLFNNPEYKSIINRLQFAQLAVNLAEKLTGKSIEKVSANTFTDCDNEAVLKAYSAGIINGVSETEFAPYNNLTRQQLATMLYRTINYIEANNNSSKITISNDISDYSDAGIVADYAKEAVATLAANDIMKGVSETQLSPRGDCSVEQGVILIYRLANKLN